jgi:hypothetical protein
MAPNASPLVRLPSAPVLLLFPSVLLSTPAAVKPILVVFVASDVAALFDDDVDGLLRFVCRWILRIVL